MPGNAASTAIATSRNDTARPAISLYRRHDDPAIVAVIMQFPTLEQLEGFVSDPSLAAAMESSGVVGVPQIRTYTEAGAADLTGRLAA